MWLTTTTFMLLMSPSQLMCCYPPLPSRCVCTHTHTKQMNTLTHMHRHTHTNLQPTLLQSASIKVLPKVQSMALTCKDIFVQRFDSLPPSLCAWFFSSGCVHRPGDPSCHLCQCNSRCGPSWSLQPVPHQHQ